MNVTCNDIIPAEDLNSTKDERAYLLELVADQYATVSQLLLSMP